MLSPGLCSISFRPLSPQDIAARAAAAGLACIEWGGDVHVPPGDTARAREVAAITAGHGLRVSSYGSYWKAGVASAEDFAKVADSAAALGAPVIRVWAGDADARHADLAKRRAVAAALAAAAGIAQQRGLAIACEFHDGSLTSTGRSTELLLAEEAAHPALGCYWQPPHAESDEVCLDGLRRVGPWLRHLHVFHWWPSASARRPLAEGAARWRRFLAALPDDGRERAALLEFMPGDDPAVLAREAAALRALLAPA